MLTKNIFMKRNYIPATKKLVRGEALFFIFTNLFSISVDIEIRWLIH